MFGPIALSLCPTMPSSVALNPRDALMDQIRSVGVQTVHCSKYLQTEMVELMGSFKCLQDLIQIPAKENVNKSVFPSFTLCGRSKYDVTCLRRKILREPKCTACVCKEGSQTYVEIL